MWRMLTVTGAWLFLLALGSGGSAAALPFSGDSRFGARVTLAARDQPLWEIVGHLRSSEHLPIRVDRTTQDERVTVFCRSRSVGEVLAAVAKHLDYTWSAPREEGGDWTLTQTPVQQKRESAARQALLERSRGEVLKTLQGMAERGRMTREQRFAALAKDLEAQAALIRKLFDTGRASVKQQVEHAEAAAAAAREGRYRYRYPSAEWEGASAALATLDPPGWDALWRGDVVRFSFPPRHDRRGLTQAQADGMIQSQVEGGGSHTTTEDGYLVMRKFSGVEHVRAELWLDTENGGATLHFLCRYLAKGSDGREEGALRAEVPPFSSTATILAVPVLDENDADLRRPVSFPPAKQPADQDTALSDVLAALDGPTPYMLIGDSYATGFRTRADLKAGQRLPLDQWLRSVCGALSVSVRREGSTLFFRQKAWAALRPLQLPDRVSRPWLALLAAQHVLPLTKLVEVSRAGPKERVEFAFRDWIVRRVAAPGDLRLLESDLGLPVEEQMDGDKSWEVCQFLSTLTAAEWALLQRPGSPVLTLRHPVPPRLAMELLDDMSLSSVIEENPPKSEFPDDPRSRPFKRPFGAAIRISDALDDGGLLRIALQQEPTTIFFSREGFGLTEDREEALEQVRRWDLTTTADKLTPVKVTHNVVKLLLDPGSEHALEYHFFTSDAPARR